MKQPGALGGIIILCWYHCINVAVSKTVQLTTANQASHSAFEDNVGCHNQSCAAPYVLQLMLIPCLAFPNHISTPLFVMQALLNGSSRDPSEAARKAARSALSHLPLTALSLVPLLTVVDKAAATEVDMPAPKTRKRSQTESVKQAADGLDILHLAGQLLSPSSDCPTPFPLPARPHPSPGLSFPSLLYCQ